MFVKDKQYKMLWKQRVRCIVIATPRESRVKNNKKSLKTVWPDCKAATLLANIHREQTIRFCLTLKLTWTVINYCRRQPYVFLSNLDLKQGIGLVYVMVDFICMGFLDLQGTEPRITKLKSIAHSGTRTHDPWIVKLLLLPLGHHTLFTIYE